MVWSSNPNNLLMLLIILLELTSALTSVGGEERRVLSTEASPRQYSHSASHRHSHHTSPGDDEGPGFNGTTHPSRLRSHPSSTVITMSTLHSSNLERSPSSSKAPRRIYNRSRGYSTESHLRPQAMASKSLASRDEPTGENTTETEDIFTTAMPFKTNNNSRLHTGTRKPRWCNNGKYLDECLVKVPPMPDIGIPSSVTAVQSACKAYNVGMSCVENWANTCLNPNNVKKFQESISGAHETFAFLCRDPKFRTAYLKHGDCYKKISPKWDECSRNFIEDMKRFHYQGNDTVHCCIRISFLQCVGEISHLYCDREAAEFLQRMAETLIRSTMKTHTPRQCTKISEKNCSMISSSPSTMNHPQGVLITTFRILVSYLLFTCVRNDFHVERVFNFRLFGSSLVMLLIMYKVG